ncbi:hypothetical protein H9P43_004537 [Blastocladiella emersonii ATCC 22665]|nr:hypothetical protein H9P43_004537 [Blastocladiella emersonii ATCC 22665]
MVTRRPLTTSSASALLALVAVLAALAAVRTAHAHPMQVSPSFTGKPLGGGIAPKYVNDVAVSNAFQIKFSCAADPTFCQRAEKAFQRAAQRIASEFKFRRTVNLDLSMFLPCGSATPAATCSEATTLGYAMPTQRFPVKHKDDGKTYLWPTALLKQTDFAAIDKGQVKWPTYDIQARFNAARNWWFSDDADAMRTDQRDLEAVALHEFLHGLGFGDDTLMSLQFSDKNPALMPYYDSTPPSVQPPPEITDSSPVVFNGQAFFRLTQPSIWNRFTFLNGSLVAKYIEPLQTALDNSIKAKTLASDPKLSSVAGTSSSDPGYSPEAAFAVLANDPTARSAMTTLYALGIRAGSLEFRPNAWPPGSNAATQAMTLESGLNPYLEGSSFAHITIAANKTSEFIMVYKAVSTSLDVTIKSTQAPQSGIGKATKDVMLALGYTPAGASTFKSFASLAEIQAAALVPGSGSGSGDSGTAASAAAPGGVRGGVVAAVLAFAAMVAVA